MTKKMKTPPPAVHPRPVSLSEPILSKRGKIVIAAGIVTAAVGFFLVTFTDPAGQNWASNLCPFVILGGYALIGVGIVVPDPAPPSSPPNPPLPQR
ncbi:MAG TPA: hypothetical protein P5079_03675 [Elusimicrobiota bacterium]|nr:hypothetical protein [Elusimicrobiota bacterium]